MEFHEYANLFPMMTDSEFEALLSDMRQNGYDETAPIITMGGKILDGRNRYKAACALGIMPPSEEYTGGDALAFVIRHNLHRRHLNESQRGVVAGRLANIKLGDNQYEGVSIDTPKISMERAAEMMNIGRATVARVKAIEKAAPELLPKIEAGEMTVHEAQKKIRANEMQASRIELAQSGASVPPSERWHIYQGDIQTWNAPRQYDFIITDPPYPKEYLPLWGVLAKRAAEWLKPGGLLIAMSGQSYLNQIYPMLDAHLTYWWTGSYLTPGGQSSQVFPRKAMPYWKPILIYCKGEYTGKWFGDVMKSDVNANEKDLHEWGQSVSGMEDLIRRFAEKDSYILDPFCGSGTTGIATINLRCYFDGLEIDSQNVEIAKGRLWKSEKSERAGETSG